MLKILLGKCQIKKLRGHKQFDLKKKVSWKAAKVSSFNLKFGQQRIVYVTQENFSQQIVRISHFQNVINT